MQTQRSFYGFTLMELILVIVLMSILSLYAFSRFIGKDSFSPFALQEQAISVIRQVQVSRMQSNISGEEPYFQLQVAPDCLGSVAACSATTQVRETRSDKVQDPTARFILNGAQNPIRFNLLGDPLNVASGGISILIQNTHGAGQCEVKINAQGYVSKGACS
ncbi:MSHA biogenesis protein MshC [Vibrio azureus]|uniref:MSHA pilin protein MshC n=1 Tax=Vibrio azureus NBRC 104587 TaxID=1219077 RepID=U3A677_9VIBR|nr:type II secretion system protein [Vibrio azureus]AUI87075.1 MSHA biogenesis protein MshC [Vibrio azureus]GAD75516.1 hypothetical protein VAZ01S_026_00220 [Vibrio azureus NBRC 104587]